MTTTVIALYDTPDQAKRALDAVIAAGFRREDAEMLGNGGGAAASLVGKLRECGIEQGEAARFAQVIGNGAALITLAADDDRAEAAVALMEEHGARDLNEIAPPTESGDTDNETVPVIEERLEVGKRRVLRGGYRVTSRVSERPVTDTVRLNEERVDIERRPADRALTPAEAEAAFKDKTIEMTETAEVATIRKEARVVGEVSLRTEQSQREETVEGKVRRVDVDVERVEPARRDRENV